MRVLESPARRGKQSDRDGDIPWEGAWREGSKVEIFLKQQNECVLLDGGEADFNFEFKVTLA